MRLALNPVDSWRICQQGEWNARCCSLRAVLGPTCLASEWSNAMLKQKDFQALAIPSAWFQPVLPFQSCGAGTQRRQLFILTLLYFVQLCLGASRKHYVKCNSELGKELSSTVSDTLLMFCSFVTLAPSHFVSFGTAMYFRNWWVMKFAHFTLCPPLTCFAHRDFINSTGPPLVAGLNIPLSSDLWTSCFVSDSQCAHQKRMKNGFL